MDFAPGIYLLEALGQNTQAADEVLAVQKEVLYHFVSQQPSVFRELSPDFDFPFSALKSIPILGTR